MLLDFFCLQEFVLHIIDAGFVSLFQICLYSYDGDSLTTS